jgi:hypothetical protein
LTPEGTKVIEIGGNPKQQHFKYLASIMKLEYHLLEKTEKYPTVNPAEILSALCTT